MLAKAKITFMLIINIDCYNSVQCQANKSVKFKPMLTLNVPIAIKVVCFSCLLKCLRSLYGKQYGPRSDCFCSGSTLFPSIPNFQMYFFLGALGFKQHVNFMI